MTLAAWGLNKSNPPLGVAIQDEEGFSPFSIALYRGNLDAAKVILEIAIAQFKPKGEDKLRRRYILAESESDDDVEEDKSNLAIACELIDDRFTIDNIAAASESVGSKVSGINQF